VGELAVQHQERQAAEVVAVQVRHRHQPDLVGIVVLLLEGDQGGGAAVQQDVAVVAGGVQQDAGLEAAAVAEGVTGADEPDLDGSFAHTMTLPCADPPGDDELRWTSHRHLIHRVSGDAAGRHGASHQGVPHGIAAARSGITFGL
jgi:hypothetical protein